MLLHSPSIATFFATATNPAYAVAASVLKYTQLHTRGGRRARRERIHSGLNRPSTHH
jgi:hypothetical protein